MFVRLLPRGEIKNSLNFQKNLGISSSKKFVASSGRHAAENSLRQPPSDAPVFVVRRLVTLMLSLPLSSTSSRAMTSPIESIATCCCWSTTRPWWWWCSFFPIHTTIHLGARRLSCASKIGRTTSWLLQASRRQKDCSRTRWYMARTATSLWKDGRILQRTRK